MNLFEIVKYGVLKQNIREILKLRKDYDDGKKTLITAPVNAGH